MHLNFHALQFLKHRELNQLYASIAMRYFAGGLVGIFVPVYLLGLGYGLREIFLLFATLYAVHAILAIPAGRFASRVGFKHTILWSIPPLVVVVILLYTLDRFAWPFSLIAIFWGINNVLFWVGYHADFAAFSEEENRGKEVGASHFIISVVAALGPFFGGVLIAEMGFKLVFALAAILLFISAALLFLTKDAYSSAPFSTRLIFKNRGAKEYLSLLGFGIDTGVWIIAWPLFVFLVAGDVVVLGAVNAASLLASLLFIAAVGVLSDFRRALTLRVGAVVNALLWVLKAGVRTIPQIFLIDIVHGAARSAINIPFDAISYDKASRSNEMEYVLFREVVIPLGRVLIFLFLAFTADLAAGFFAGSGASLLYLLF